jgi:hypothetical protein
MTVKERLHKVVDEMSEQEAEETLRRIESRRNDPLLRFLDQAPLDDEPMTPEEEAAIAEVDADRSSGAARVPFADVKRDHS